MNESRFQVKVPASSANLGPGFDVLALALDLHLTATVTQKRGDLEVSYAGTLADAGRTGEKDQILLALAKSMGKEMDQLSGLHVHATSEIPLTRGLGSSAAGYVAGILLGNILSGSKLTTHDIHRMAWELEGHRDSVAASFFGGLVFTAPGFDDPEIAHPLPLPLHPNWRFAVAWPEVAVSTQLARSVLPPSLPHEATPRNVGRTLLLLHGLKEADPRLVKAGILDEVHLPYRRHLVPGYQKVYDAALEAGAAGLTLSSSGPSLVAPVLGEETGKKVLAAMQEAFADSGQDANGRLLEVAGKAQLDVLPPKTP